jgi:hypothetical protein
MKYLLGLLLSLLLMVSLAAQTFAQNTQPILSPISIPTTALWERSDAVYRGTHATAPRRKAGLHQPERPTLFIFALAAASPRSQHSSYHQGQVITLLRQLGAEAVSTDFLEYFDEGPESRW